MSIKRVHTPKWKWRVVMVAFWPADALRFLLRGWLVHVFFWPYQWSARLGWFAHDRLTHPLDKRSSKLCEFCEEIPGRLDCSRCGGTGSEQHNGYGVMPYAEWSDEERADQWSVAHA